MLMPAAGFGRTKACDQCRARKAKCDEGRPMCSHCKENNLFCVYKEVPPHKYVFLSFLSL